MRYLITGGTGFIGSSLIDNINLDLNEVFVLVRNYSKQFDNRITQILFDFNEPLFLKNFFPSGIDVLIHLISPSSYSNNSFSSFEKYREINTDFTFLLSRCASDFNVKRIIYLSTIKVHGETTLFDHPFTPNSSYSPFDPYAISKCLAELELIRLSQLSSTEVVIIRSPLVYGPNVKSNFSFIAKLIKLRIPFPFLFVKNKRSIISISNLVNFILICADFYKSPLAANQSFLISDGIDISTPSLFKSVSKAYGVRLFLFPFPIFLIKFIAYISDKMPIFNSLFRNLQLDSSKAYNLLNWRPIVTIDQELQNVVRNDLKES